MKFGGISESLLAVAVLFWLTGLHRPPSGGFRRLEKRMTLAVGGDVARLPCCHTCSFQLDLPEYPSQEELQTKLKRALEEQAFGLA